MPGQCFAVSEHAFSRIVAKGQERCRARWPGAGSPCWDNLPGPGRLPELRGSVRRAPLPGGDAGRLAAGEPSPSLRRWGLARPRGPPPEAGGLLGCLWMHLPQPCGLPARNPEVIRTSAHAQAGTPPVRWNAGPTHDDRRVRVRGGRQIRSFHNPRRPPCTSFRRHPCAAAGIPRRPSPRAGPPIATEGLLTTKAPRPRGRSAKPGASLGRKGGRPAAEGGKDSGRRADQPTCRTRK
jgi:hypothetical protein